MEAVGGGGEGRGRGGGQERGDWKIELKREWVRGIDDGLERCMRL